MAKESNWLNSAGSPVGTQQATVQLEIPCEAVGDDAKTAAAVNWIAIAIAFWNLFTALKSGDAAKITAALQALINAFMGLSILLALLLIFSGDAQAQLLRRKAACANGVCEVVPARVITQSAFSVPTKDAKTTVTTAPATACSSSERGIFNGPIITRIRERPRLFFDRFRCGG